MKAVKLYAPGDLRLVELPKPIPGLGEVLVRVREVGICASDIHYFRYGRIGDVTVDQPLILGHEFAGEIAEIGPDVTSVNVGDRVAVEPSMPCRACDMCETLDYNLCRNIKFCGTPPIDGAFREFLSWPADLVVPVPDTISMGEAAMLEPLAVGVYGVEIAGDVQGKTVGVLGVGAIGLSILQAAKAAGCGETLVADFLPDRLELAQRLGADRVFEAGPGVVEAVSRATEGRGLDFVFEAAGENDAVCQATEIVRPKGTVVVGGIPREDHMTVCASMIRRKALTIKMIRRSNNTLHRSIDLVSDGKVDVKSFITHRLPVERITEAFEIARDHKDGALRVLVII